MTYTKNPDSWSGSNSNVLNSTYKNIPQSENFLKLLFSKCSGLGEIRFIPVKHLLNGGKKRVMSMFVPAKNIHQINGVKLNIRGTHTCFGVSTRKVKKGDKKSVLEVPALWVDIDCKNFKDGKDSKDSIIRYIEGIAKQTGLKPSFVIDSGHGFHLYFLLGQPEVIHSPADISKIEVDPKCWTVLGLI